MGLERVGATWSMAGGMAASERCLLFIHARGAHVGLDGLADQAPPPAAKGTYFWPRAALEFF